MRRHGAVELLLVLPDGSKSLVPAAWTDHPHHRHRLSGQGQILALLSLQSLVFLERFAEGDRALSDDSGTDAEDDW
jgi:hypothetical protein